MAFKQEYIDRYKAQGFYKHVEWNRRNGVMVKVFEKKPGDKLQTLSFEASTCDVEYDQRFDNDRVFWLSREDCVKFMVNCGLQTAEIVQAFLLIQGCQVVTKHV